MTRRLFGSVSGPIAFFLVAALVFAGLGWVTYSALNVERSQRESAARAELGNNLRVALWQLDSRMLPALGVEDSRPYYHYAPPDPAATPLFVANLADWMKLHFRLDPATGWSSPLVCDPPTADLVREAWAEVSPRNMSPERALVLEELKFRCPARQTYDLFAATDRSISSDSLSLAAPLVAGDVQQENALPLIPPSMNDSPGKPAPFDSKDSKGNSNTSIPNADANTDVVRVLGIEICLGVNNSPNLARLETQPPVQKYQQRSAIPGQQGENPRGLSQATGGGRGNNRLAQKDSLDNKKQVADWMNRAGLVDRAIREAKNAAEFQMPKGQPQNSYGTNYLPGIDGRNYSNPANSMTGNKTGAPVPPVSQSLPVKTPGGGGIGIGSKPSQAPPGPGSGIRDEKDRFLPEQGLSRKPADPNDKTLGESLAKKYESGPPVNVDVNKKRTLESAETALLSYEFSTWFLQHNELRLRQAIDQVGKRKRVDDAERTSAADRSAGSMSPPTPPTVPPGQELPLPAPTVPAASPAQPRAIHLGSMRPQWVTAPDGSDMLVLVRAAKVDERVVYQGIVVDWPKLAAALTEEIQPLFPHAKLVPIKDFSAVYPDRAMTALPIQLDPGPDSELPPAGWTPLRIGLLLAWLAAIIAFAAVGFAGWGLLDLAERRMRFVSAVTHELRTPLTSLRLYLDLLVSGMIQDEKQRQEYLGTLALESDRLHRLIDNVLDYARLEKRARNGDIKPVAVNGLLDQLRETWTDRVLQDGKALLVISTLPGDRTVSTDVAMVHQIVGNLIDNARKYTRDAADKRIWVWAKPGSGNGVVLEVEDRGPGVALNERKSIFKPFRRGEQADSKAGGAGLGLALAKSWAEVLGSTLTYRPADGGTGACFRLELPGH